MIRVLFLSLWGFVQCAPGALAQEDDFPEINIYTSQTKPYQYLDEAGNAIGLQVDLVRAFMESTGLDYNIQITNLNRGLRNVTQNDHSLIFSLRRTDSREENYHWITPLLKHDHYLISLNDSSMENLSQEEVLKSDFKAICKEGSWQCEEMESFGFKEENILRIANIEISDIANLVLRGRGHYLITDMRTLTYSAQNIGQDVSQFSPRFKIASKQGYLVAPKTIDPQILEILNQSDN